MFYFLFHSSIIRIIIPLINTSNENPNFIEYSQTYNDDISQNSSIFENINPIDLTKKDILIDKELNLNIFCEKPLNLCIKDIKCTKLEELNPEIILKSSIETINRESVDKEDMETKNNDKEKKSSNSEEDSSDIDVVTIDNLKPKNNEDYKEEFKSKNNYQLDTPLITKFEENKRDYTLYSESSTSKLIHFKKQLISRELNLKDKTITTCFVKKNITDISEINPNNLISNLIPFESKKSDVGNIIDINFSEKSKESSINEDIKTSSCLFTEPNETTIDEVNNETINEKSECNTSTILLSINNKKTVYYFIDSINSFEITMKYIFNVNSEKNSLTKKSQNIYEFFFSINEMVFLRRFNPMKKKQLLIKFSDSNSDNIEYIIEGKNKDFENIISKSIYCLYFSLECPIFSRIDITIPLFTKYLEISTESVKDSVNQKISGKLFYDENNIDIKKLFFFTNKIFNFERLIDNFLNSEFLIYNFKDLKNNSIIRFNKYINYKIKTKLITIKKFLNEFKEMNYLIKIPKTKIIKYKSIIEITNNIQSQPIIIWDNAIMLVKEACDVFLENITKIKEISSNPLKTYNEKKKEINNLLNNILIYLTPTWNIKKTVLKSNICLDEKIISFYIFLHREVRKLFEFWNNHIFN